jgi:uncharacterized membrane protein YkvA (DUF1232 family)
VATLPEEESVCKHLKAIGTTLKRELRVYQLVLKDSRTPKLAKWLLGLAVGYTLLPFDLIPDFIPVIGHLDDIIIVPALITLALKLIPAEVVADCRRSVEASKNKL